jgi:hypothetical protein
LWLHVAKRADFPSNKYWPICTQHEIYSRLEACR